MQLLCYGNESLSVEGSKTVPDSGNVIFPGTQIVEHGDQYQTQVPAGIVAIQRIWVIGCIVYQDAARQVHHTKFWFRSTYADISKPLNALANHPLTYLPITGFELWDAEAD
jgi:hypothetical protein